MRHSRICFTLACALLVIIETPWPALADGVNQSGPLLLSNTQLDQVTAGTAALDLTSLAIAAGNTASASANGAGASSHTDLPGGGFVEGGAIAGNSVAIAPGGTMNASVTTSATTSLPIVSGGAGGTLTTPFSQTTISMSYAYGGTTVFLP